MKITIIKPFKSFRDEPKENKKYAAIVDGDADAIVMNVQNGKTWLVGGIVNHSFGYESPNEPIKFAPWQFLGKPYYERVDDDSPQYITGTVMYAATQNGIRRAFEEPFFIKQGEITFERDACPTKYREEIQEEAIRLAKMTEVVVYKQSLMPREKRHRQHEQKTARIFVPTDFLESWFEKNISGGWKAWWYRYTPEHTRTLADDMKAVGLTVEEA